MFERLAPPTTGSVLAQVSPEEAAQVCTPEGSESASSICTFVYELTEIAWLAQAMGTMLRITFTLVIAFAAQRIVKRLIKRFVRGLTAKGLERLGTLRRGSLLADTQQIDLGRAQMRTETLGMVLRSVATFAIWTVALLTVLGELGFNLGPLIAGAGIAGVAIGFGAQNLVKDFLSGIFMLIEDQYGIGDIIDTGEATGIVETISLRTTRLRDVHGTVWHVPNGEIRRIGNFSQQWARALLDIAVAYDTDLPRAMDVIKQVADGLWTDDAWSSWILSEPEVWGVESFGANEIVLRLVVQTAPLEQWKVARELRQRIKAAFDEAGIEIPFPQRTVWMHSAKAESDI